MGEADEEPGPPSPGERRAQLSIEVEAKDAPDLRGHLEDRSRLRAANEQDLRHILDRRGMRTPGSSATGETAPETPRRVVHPTAGFESEIREGLYSEDEAMPEATESGEAPGAEVRDATHAADAEEERAE